MLENIKSSNLVSVSRFVKRLSLCYVPDISKFSGAEKASLHRRVFNTSLRAKRCYTVRKLPAYLIEEKSRLASMDMRGAVTAADSLSQGMIKKSGDINIQLFQVLLKAYQAAPPVLLSSASQSPLAALTERGASAEPGAPEVISLGGEIKTLLSAYQGRLISEQNWQALSLMSVHFSIMGQLLLEGLEEAERILLTPYIRFVQDCMIMPWSRLLSAIVEQKTDTLVTALVEHMLAQLSSISMAVYVRWNQSHGDDSGLLSSQDVLVRELMAFQLYLWTNLLEGSLQDFEKELLLVNVRSAKPSGVPRMMTLEVAQLLVEDMLARLSADEKELAFPYLAKLLETLQRHDVAAQTPGPTSEQHTSQFSAPAKRRLSLRPFARFSQTRALG